MEDVQLIVDLVLALGVAFLGGFVAQRFGLPVLLGYIVAGVVIGPNTPGLVAGHGEVETLANIGIAFLMFTIGVELSFEELNRVRRVALISGGLQVPLTVLLGTIAGVAIGWTWQASVLLGCGFALSSTIVAIKLSSAKGEMNSPYARTALGIGIVQDLSLVPIIALLPILKGDSGNVLLSVVLSLGMAAIALVVVFVVGTRVVPRVMFVVARTGSRELFLLTIVLIALGTAVASERAGLSLALGAFLAGLVVSESEFNNQVLAETIPIRDLFATLFFVSVGMLLEPQFVLDNIEMVALLLAILVVGKIIILGGALLAAGANFRVSTRATTLLAQMGEFSFVLAGLGLADGIIDDSQYGLILAVALGSILLTPFLVALDPRLIGLAAHLPGIRRREASLVGNELDESGEGVQVVLCGYGRVGSVLGGVLARHDYRYSVIEMNPTRVRELRDRGVPAFYGDAGTDALLMRSGIMEATVLVVTVPDLVGARSVVRRAKSLNPTLTIIARSSTRQGLAILREAGAHEVIQPEIEAGLECVRHMLATLGQSPIDTAEILAMRRMLSYADPEKEIVATAAS
jgi:CPA2 family monovalent cation:H+ antiporter-2